MTKEIALQNIVDNPFQPRKTFDQDAIQSLADEIKAEGFWNGALQGRRTKGGQIELVYGHRRLRALRLLKQPTVAIRLVDLTDAQMALRALEENLQREGLKDFEKADAVKLAVEVATAEHKRNGTSASHALRDVATRLGLTKQWVSELFAISSGIPDESRQPIEDAGLSAVTAHRAKKWGGDRYVDTLIKRAKAGQKTSQTTVDRMKTAVTKAPPAVQAKLQNEVWSGKITDPAQIESRSRTLAAQHQARQKEPPPDLKAVIRGWTHRLKDWEKQLREVTPYMDYVDEVPVIGRDFREALQTFIASAQKLL